MPLHLLLVEADDSTALPLTARLERDGFTVTRVVSGTEALRAEGADLVLLVFGLPDLDGRDVCRRLRARSAVPIILISGPSDEFDPVVAFEIGADDHVRKPFWYRELVARIRAVSRRTRARAAPDVQRVGELVLDRRTRRVTIGSREVELTPKEFDLLALLAEDPGAVINRERILVSLWGPQWSGPTKRLDAHVASLRKKLGDRGAIESVRGVGFRLRTP